MKKLFTNLTFWVLTAIVCGILLGHFAPEIALKQILNDDIKATFITLDPGLGAPLWYIGEDANIYVVNSADGVNRQNYSFGKKARSLFVFGGNPHIIGTDGYFYMGHRQTWLQVPFN